MTRSVLTLNAGSSSIKFSLYELADNGTPDHPVLTGQIDGIGSNPHIKASDGNGKRIDDIDIPLHGNAENQHHEALEFLISWLHDHENGWRVVAVGHRVVHGGERYSRPMLLDDNIIEHLTRLIPLAPLHQPHNLSAIRAVARLFPELAQVACFDTEFHASQPWVAQACALPRRLTEAGIKRYGFHGLSYEYIASALPAALGPLAEGRVVVAHLGNGASLCAMRGRRSVASTMGFSTLDGLMMGTRCGSLDPGIVLHLIQQQGMNVSALEKLLYEKSGLLGVSSISGDMRTLEASAAPEARQAIELYAYRLNQQLGSMAAALGGLDALVFTAGIGENSALMRQRVGSGAAWLGLELDKEANQAAASGLRCISLATSRVAVWVIPTDEEGMIAQHTQAVLRGNAPAQRLKPAGA